MLQVWVDRQAENFVGSFYGGGKVGVRGRGHVSVHGKVGNEGVEIAAGVDAVSGKFFEKGVTLEGGYSPPTRMGKYP